MASTNVDIPPPIEAPPFTVVSAFMSQINSRNDRGLNRYVDLGHQLLRVNVRQTIFIERAVFSEFFYHKCRLLHSRLPYTNDRDLIVRTVTYGDASYDYVVIGHLAFVFFEKSDIYLSTYRNMATQFSLNTCRPEKDTIDYMFVQCHKTEWVAIAIAIDADLFGGESNLTGMYAWIDFGIQHMFPSNHALCNSIYTLRDRVIAGRWDRSKVYAPSCWGSYAHFGVDIYRSISWVFSGSAFGGSASALLEFARLTKEKCIDILTKKHHLMWEVNVWALIRDDHPELFALFYGNHNAGILDHWLSDAKPVTESIAQ
jgi:hypothetical protein